MAIVSNNHPSNILTIVPSMATAVTHSLTYITGEKMGFSFVPTSDIFNGSPYIDEVVVNLSAISGTPRLRAYIYSDNGSGRPGSLITNGSSDETSPISSAGWVTITWSSPYPQVSAGTQYWVVIECTAATSATVRTVPAQQQVLGMCSLVGDWRFLADYSSNGVNWTGPQRSMQVGWRLRFTNGTDVTYIGLPFSSMGYRSSVSYSIYGGNREDGYAFTTPGCRLRISSVSMAVRDIGSPSTPVYVRVYKGTSTSYIAQSNALPASAIGDASKSFFDFNPPLELEPNTQYRVVCGTNGGDSSNYYQMYVNAVHPGSAPNSSPNMVPFSSFCSFRNGSSWSDTYDECPPVIFSINSFDNEFSMLQRAPSHLGTVSRETGANARGGSGACVKMTPSLTSIPLYYSFLIPVTGSQQSTISFWHKITSGFNGSLKVTVFDTNDSTKLIDAANVTLSDNGSYNQYTSSSFTPSSTALARVVIEAYNGSTSGSVFIDDMQVS